MNRFVALLSLTLSAAILSPPSLAQQPGGLLPSREAFKLYKQIGDHMEATSLAVPELARAGAPLIENVRQASDALQIGATREHSGLIYKLTRNARIYLDIADAVPTTNPFAAEVERQLIELRQAVQRVEIHFQAQLAAKEDRLRGSDRDNLRRYSQQNRELGPAQPDEKRVVFLGDSITDGWPLNQYFPGKPYVNRGIGGQITSQMLARMKADVLDLKPTVMVVLAGTNDIGRGVSTDTIKNNLSLIADLAVGARDPAGLRFHPARQRPPRKERSQLQAHPRASALHDPRDERVDSPHVRRPRFRVPRLLFGPSGPGRIPAGRARRRWPATQRRGVPRHDSPGPWSRESGASSSGSQQQEEALRDLLGRVGTPRRRCLLAPAARLASHANGVFSPESPVCGSGT